VHRKISAGAGGGGMSEGSSMRRPGSEDPHRRQRKFSNVNKKCLKAQNFGFSGCLDIEKFPLAPMGVLAPGSAHSRPSAQPPIDPSGSFRSKCLGGGGQFSRHFTPIFCDFYPKNFVT
jgi:hypothetical protein